MVGYCGGICGAGFCCNSFDIIMCAFMASKAQRTRLIQVSLALCPYCQFLCPVCPVFRSV